MQELRTILIQMVGFDNDDDSDKMGFRISTGIKSHFWWGCQRDGSQAWMSVFEPRASKLDERGSILLILLFQSSFHPFLLISQLVRHPDFWVPILRSNMAQMQMMATAMMMGSGPFFFFRFGQVFVKCSFAESSSGFWLQPCWRHMV